MTTAAYPPMPPNVVDRFAASAISGYLSPLAEPPVRNFQGPPYFVNRSTAAGTGLRSELNRQLRPINTNINNHANGFLPGTLADDFSSRLRPLQTTGHRFEQNPVSGQLAPSSTMKFTQHRQSRVNGANTLHAHDIHDPLITVTASTTGPLPLSSQGESDRGTRSLISEHLELSELEVSSQTGTTERDPTPTDHARSDRVEASTTPYGSTTNSTAIWHAHRKAIAMGKRKAQYPENVIHNQNAPPTVASEHSSGSLRRKPGYRDLEEALFGHDLEGIDSADPLERTSKVHKVAQHASVPPEELITEEEEILTIPLLTTGWVSQRLKNGRDVYLKVAAVSGSPASTHPDDKFLTPVDDLETNENVRATDTLTMQDLQAYPEQYDLNRDLLTSDRPASFLHSVRPSTISTDPTVPSSEYSIITEEPPESMRSNSALEDDQPHPGAEKPRSGPQILTKDEVNGILDLVDAMGHQLGQWAEDLRQDPDQAKRECHALNRILRRIAPFILSLGPPSPPDAPLLPSAPLHFPSQDLSADHLTRIKAHEITWKAKHDLWRVSFAKHLQLISALVDQVLGINKEEQSVSNIRAIRKTTSAFTVKVIDLALRLKLSQHVLKELELRRSLCKYNGRLRAERDELHRQGKHWTMQDSDRIWIDDCTKEIERERKALRDVQERVVQKDMKNLPW